jgi:hypothetical protein
MNANAFVQIDYRSLGSRKHTEFGVQMPVYHRNAMSWDDDRRAASFVSARDPAAVLFARYTESIMRKRLRPEVPPNVQYALALFEALNIYGINYIIDPSSSYISMSEDASALDSLNYPYQTLFYRGGDCDDLSILFCSLLEVLNIDTAFVTVPGHIYMAFDTGLRNTMRKEENIIRSEENTVRSEELGVRSLREAGTAEAARKEQSSSLLTPNFPPTPNSSILLIEHDGKYWMPVEITIPAEGFTQAVRVGAREWQGAAVSLEANQSGTTEPGMLYPMRDSWKLYPPVSVPGAGERLPSLPAEDALIKAIDNSLTRFTGK